MANEVVQSSAEGSTQESNSLDNMGTNILKELTEAQPGADADTSTVVAQEGTETAATQPQAETTPPAEDAGTVKRLEQQLADSNNTIRMMGIDPNGTEAEGLRSGVITLEQLRPAAPVSTETTSPQVPIDQKLTNLQSKLSTRQGDVTAANYNEDIKEILGVVNELVETNKSLNQRNEQSDLKSVQQQNIATVYDELGQTEVFKNLDPSVQEIAKEMVLGAVDIGVARLAVTQPDRDGLNYTPVRYKHVVNQFAPKFNDLITKVFEAGKTANTQQIVKNNETVAPITAGTGSTTVQPPQQRFKIEDITKNTSEYLSKEAAQV
ncbi:hypothetical protein LCGC14_0840370 [marine sediment metagenome]|uniref:Uncharacterized protein n=1 Tax=marine sediment metagenome TaxID=412755 RepID=A0A0F9PDE3_9ZZZZ